MFHQLVVGFEPRHHWLDVYWLDNRQHSLTREDADAYVRTMTLVSDTDISWTRAGNEFMAMRFASRRGRLHFDRHMKLMSTAKSLDFMEASLDGHH